MYFMKNSNLLIFNKMSFFEKKSFPNKHQSVLITSTICKLDCTKDFTRELRSFIKVFILDFSLTH